MAAAATVTQRSTRSAPRRRQDQRRQQRRVWIWVGAILFTTVITTWELTYLKNAVSQREQLQPQPPQPRSSVVSTTDPNEALARQLQSIMNSAAAREAAGDMPGAFGEYRRVIQTLSPLSSRTPILSQMLADARRGFARAGRGSIFKPNPPTNSNPTGGYPDPLIPSIPQAGSLQPRSGSGDDDTLPAIAMPQPTVPSKGKPLPAKPSSPRATPHALNLDKVSGGNRALSRGLEALNAKNPKGAITAFREALSADRASVYAAHGLAIALYEGGDKRQAIATLEKLCTGSPDRAVIHNVAVLHLRDKNPMRAAKYIRDFLARPDVPLDEPLQNVFGAALMSAPEEARNGQAWADFFKSYTAYDHRLADARADGLGRWGMMWLGFDEAESNWKQLNQAEAGVMAAQLAYGRAGLEAKHAYDSLYDLEHGFALHPERQLNNARARLREATERHDKLGKQLQAARDTLAATPVPRFPSEISFIPLDASTPERHPPQR